MVNTKLKKDDMVVVIAGADKGKRGKILFVDKKNGRVVIEGINKKTKHMKAQGENQGGRIQIEYPINISNVMFFDEKSKKGVKLGVQLKDDKSKVRISRKTGKSID